MSYLNIANLLEPLESISLIEEFERTITERNIAKLIHTEIPGCNDEERFKVVELLLSLTKRFDFNLPLMQVWSGLFEQCFTAENVYKFAVRETASETMPLFLTSGPLFEAKQQIRLQLISQQIPFAAFFCDGQFFVAINSNKIEFKQLCCTNTNYPIETLQEELTPKGISLHEPLVCIAPNLLHNLNALKHITACTNMNLANHPDLFAQDTGSHDPGLSLTHQNSAKPWDPFQLYFQAETDQLLGWRFITNLEKSEQLTAKNVALFIGFINKTASNKPKLCHENWENLVYAVSILADKKLLCDSWVKTLMHSRKNYPTKGKVDWLHHHIQYRVNLDPAWLQSRYTTLSENDNEYLWPLMLIFLEVFKNKPEQYLIDMENFCKSIPRSYSNYDIAADTINKLLELLRNGLLDQHNCSILFTLRWERPLENIIYSNGFFDNPLHFNEGKPFQNFLGSSYPIARIAALKKVITWGLAESYQTIIKQHPSEAFLLSIVTCPPLSTSQFDALAGCDPETSELRAKALYVFYHNDLLTVTNTQKIFEPDVPPGLRDLVSAYLHRKNIDDVPLQLTQEIIDAALMQPGLFDALHSLKKRGLLVTNNINILLAKKDHFLFNAIEILGTRLTQSMLDVLQECDPRTAVKNFEVRANALPLLDEMGLLEPDQPFILNIDSSKDELLKIVNLLRDIHKEKIPMTRSLLEMFLAHQTPKLLLNTLKTMDKSLLSYDNIAKITSQPCLEALANFIRLTPRFYETRSYQAYFDNLLKHIFVLENDKIRNAFTSLLEQKRTGVFYQSFFEICAQQEEKPLEEAQATVMRFLQNLSKEESEKEKRLLEKREQLTGNPHSLTFFRASSTDVEKIATSGEADFNEIIRRIPSTKQADIEVQLTEVTPQHISSLHTMMSSQTHLLSDASFIRDPMFPFTALLAVRINQISPLQFGTLMTLWGDLKFILPGAEYIELFTHNLEINKRASDFLLPSLAPSPAFPYLINQTPEQILLNIYEKARDLPQSEKGFWVAKMHRSAYSVSHFIHLSLGLRYLALTDDGRLIIPSFGLRKAFLDGAFSDAVRLNPVIGESTPLDIRIGGLKRHRDITIPFPGNPLPTSADNHPAPRVYDFLNHDAYHALRASRIAKEETAQYISIGDILSTMQERYNVEVKKLTQRYQAQVSRLPEFGRAIEKLPASTQHQLTEEARSALNRLIKLIAMFKNARQLYGKLKFTLWDMEPYASGRSLDHPQKTEHEDFLRIVLSIERYLIDLTPQDNLVLSRCFTRKAAASILDVVKPSAPLLNAAKARLEEEFSTENQTSLEDFRAIFMGM